MIACFGALAICVVSLYWLRMVLHMLTIDSMNKPFKFEYSRVFDILVRSEIANSQRSQY